MSELRQLTRQDVLFVGGETARVYQHTAGLVLLDNRGRPDFNFKAFREHVIERVGQIPHFHWKLHEVPLGLDLPYWVDDDNFNYEHHIKPLVWPSNRNCFPTPGLSSTGLTWRWRNIWP